MTVTSAYATAYPLAPVTTGASLVEHLATADLRRLPTSDLKAEAEYTVYLLAELNSRNDYEPGYFDYVTKRAEILRDELNRRFKLTQWQANDRSSIPLDFLLSLKQSVDIRDVFNSLGVLVIPSSTGREKYACPVHGDDHPSGVVYVPEQRYWCFGCNSGGDVYDALMAFRCLTFRQAVETLAAYAGVTIPHPARRKGTVPV